MLRWPIDLQALRVAVYLKQFPHAAVADLADDASTEAVQRAVQLGYIALGVTGPYLTNAGADAINLRLEQARESGDVLGLEDFALFSFELDENRQPLGPKPRH